MLFFWAMKHTAFTEVLDEIQKLARGVDERRGEFAAALWIVSDWFEEVSGALVDHRDSEELVGGWRLAVGTVAPARPLRGVEDAPSAWRRALCVRRGDTVIPACEAPPEVAAVAVTRLGGFLEEYTDALRVACGNAGDRETCRSVLEVVYGLSAADVPDAAPVQG